MIIEKHRCGIRQWAPVCVSLICGVAAGILHPTHFLNGRLLFGIALGIAAVSWLYLLIIGRRGDERWLDGWMGSSLTLFPVAVAGLALADAHGIWQAVLFGLTVALLGYLLIRSAQYLRDDRIPLCLR